MTMNGKFSQEGEIKVNEQFKEKGLKKEGILKPILIIVLITIFLCGCGSEEMEISVKKESVQVVEEMQDNSMEEVDEKDADADEKQIDLDKETKEENEEMPKAEKKEGIIEIGLLVSYVIELDPKTPHVVVWNEEEEYLVDIKDGEYYQLKDGERIFEIWNDGIDAIWSTIPSKENEGMPWGFEIIPDYANFESPQECIYGIYLKENPDIPISFTYYLDKPNE